MSFTDMMTSGRGPGLIGMLLALVVLFGFGALYVLVFDERLRGGGQTIESLLAEQEREIGALAERLANGKRQLGFHAGQEEVNRLFEEQIADNRGRVRRIADLAARRAGAGEAVAGLRQEFEGYRARYREMARLEATGERIERLTLADGQVLRDVEIRGVDEVGLTLRHASGLQRIPFRDLPLEMRVRFDREGTSAVLDAPPAEIPRKDAEAAVADSPPAAETRRERLVREIALKERQIREHHAALRQLDIDLRLKAEASAERAPRGRMAEGDDRVALLRSRRESREAEVRRLREEIARLRRGL